MKANCRNGWRVEYPEKVLTTKFFDEDVRVAYVDDDWYFVLDDICKAVKIKNSRDVASIIPAKRMKKVAISAQDIVADVDSTDVTSVKNRNGVRKTQVYTCTNEFGVYASLGRSRKLEARQFVDWSYEVLSTLRKKEGIAAYNLAKLTEKDTQDRILDHINHAKYDGWTVYYDSVTDWWFAEGMDRHGDVVYIPVDDPYGRPFKFPEDYEPTFSTFDPNIYTPCPWYDCKPTAQD